MWGRGDRLPDLNPNSPLCDLSSDSPPALSSRVGVGTQALGKGTPGEEALRTCQLPAAGGQGTAPKLTHIPGYRLAQSLLVGRFSAISQRLFLKNI